jgi:hypothetical protein
MKGIYCQAGQGGRKLVSLEITNAPGRQDKRKHDSRALVENLKCHNQLAHHYPYSIPQTIFAFRVKFQLIPIDAHHPSELSFIGTPLLFFYNDQLIYF